MALETEQNRPAGVRCGGKVSATLVLCLVGQAHVFGGGAEGFGGKVMRITSFFGVRFGSSSSPTPVATVGPRGGRGGGLFACGFGFGFCSSDMFATFL